MKFIWIFYEIFRILEKNGILKKIFLEKKIFFSEKNAPPLLFINNS
jgi:hypothetical protein